jgi:hypothetical protein
VATIESFGASPATITAGGSSSLTGVFSNGTGVITPGDLAATSGIAVKVSPAATTTYTLTVTGSSGPAVTQTVTVTVNPAVVTPTVTVTPSASSITTAQALTVTVAVSGPSGDATPTGSVTLTSGSYTSTAATLSSGSATINVTAGSLAAGSDTLTVSYTPDTASSSIYSSATGTASVTVTVPAKITPTVTVTPSASSITPVQALTVTVAVSVPSGDATPTGSVTLTSGNYNSGAVTLSSGSATIDVLAGSLATGSDTLTVSYTPDTASSSAYNSATGTNSVTVAKITPTVTVTPSASSITPVQALTVTVAVSVPSGDATPTGSVTLTSGNYNSGAVTLSSGGATIDVLAGSLAIGSDTLTVSYTPDTASSSAYNNATGTNTVTVAKITPTVTVTPSLLTIGTTQPLTVTVAVSAPSGDATPTGSVTLTGGGYNSGAVTLSSGSATIDISGGSLAAGSDVLTASYTPDSTSSSIYNTATGASSAVTVTTPSTIKVTTPSTTLAVTDQLLGMNLASWYDVVGNATAVNSAFGLAGIQAIRWPGGSWSDEYHWQTPNNSSNPNLPYMCENNSSGVPDGNTSWGGYSTFKQFVTSIVQGGNYDLALTADYGTDTACTGPGEPSEAEAWVAAAVADGIQVSHMTVGNEEYGSWETDLHSNQHDGTTYAAAVAGSSGYYTLIKAASKSTLVGVDVEEDDSTGGWDDEVMSGAKGYYDFVEYHYYPQGPYQESDSFLVNQAAQDLTTNINTIKSELAKWGTPDTPIYVGEIGSVYTNPGKQSWSITQGLYAGQLLGEMMNAGVSRATWWIGFGNCNGQSGNDQSYLYGWQDFGAYNVFSDGPVEDPTCAGGGPIGTMSPTARAFQLFSNVAVTGESVLTASVTGDATDVVAYAATHSGGTAVVAFNRNETTSKPVVITISGQAAATSVTVITYDKAIYDQTDAATPVWAAPTTTTISSPTLPLTLTLTPWSMNVVIIQ